MTRRLMARIVPLTLLLAVTGCASDVPASTPSPSIIKASAAPSRSSTATPAETPNPKQDVLEVGDTFIGKTVKITLIKIDRKIPEAYVKRPWQGALVKTCVTNTGDETRLPLSWDPWSMYDADDGRYVGSDESYDDFPTPTYPHGYDGDPTYAAGDCVKGWIIFVAGTAKITTLRYSSSTGDAAVWHL